MNKTMQTIQSFVLGALLSLGAGAIYFGLADGDGRWAEAEAKGGGAKPKPGKYEPKAGAKRWLMLSRDQCIGCPEDRMVGCTCY